MKQVLFSIATPCFNSVQTIERTLKSVLAQEFKDYEYIIVDGGSTDGTLDIIRQYEPLFEGRMKWKSEPDKGLYDAFNKGVHRSTGVYCWNVNADDYMEPDALTKLAAFIAKQNVANLPVISGGMHFISQEGKVLSTAFSTGENLKHAFLNDYIGVPHPATLVPKSIYDAYGAFDVYYKIIGDADWFHRVYAAGVDFKFIAEVITNMSDGGISTQFVFSRYNRDIVHFLNKYYSNPLIWFLHWAKWLKAFYIQKILFFIKRKNH